MRKTQKFPLRYILCVTTGRLLFDHTRQDTPEWQWFFRIFGWMANHQEQPDINEFRLACSEMLCDLYPEFGGAREAFDEMFDEANKKNITIKEEEIDNIIEELKKNGFKDEYDVPQLPQHLMPKDKPSIVNKIINLLGLAGIEVINLTNKGETDQEYKEHIHNYTTKECCQTLMNSSRDQWEWDKNLETIKSANDGNLPREWDNWIWKSGLWFDVRNRWDNIQIKV
jgi:hypothetical protein